MKIRELQFFVSSLTGRSRAEDFLLKLSKKNSRDYAVIRARLARAQTGNLGNYRDFGDKTLELKIPQGPGYRVYCTLTEDFIVAVHANVKGKKKSQTADIQFAKKLVTEFWEEFKEAKEK
jgi:putative addiction module killer protein